MNIPKAIEILTKWNKEGFVAVSDDLEKAEKLGIEALKRYQEVKQQLTFSGMPLLPGETEDSSEEAEEINPESTNP